MDFCYQPIPLHQLTRTALRGTGPSPRCPVMWRDEGMMESLIYIVNIWLSAPGGDPGSAAYRPAPARRQAVIAAHCVALVIPGLVVGLHAAPGACAPAPIPRPHPLPDDHRPCFVVSSHHRPHRRSAHPIPNPLHPQSRTYRPYSFLLFTHPPALPSPARIVTFRPPSLPMFQQLRTPLVFFLMSSTSHPSHPMPPTASNAYQQQHHTTAPFSPPTKLRSASRTP